MKFNKTYKTIYLVCNQIKNSRRWLLFILNEIDFAWACHLLPFLQSESLSQSPSISPQIPFLQQLSPPSQAMYFPYINDHIKRKISNVYIQEFSSMDCSKNQWWKIFNSSTKKKKLSKSWNCLVLSLMQKGAEHVMKIIKKPKS